VDAPEGELAEGAESILESAPDAILAVDPHGFVRYANAALARLVGEDRASLRSRPLALLAASSRDMEHLLAPLRGEGPSGETTLRLRRAGARPLVVAITASPHRGSDGSALGAILCVRDATAQRRQSELARRNDELEHCVQTLAHDLRSPLVALLGFSRLLRQDYADQLDDTGAHFIDRIEQAGRTMETLIHDLLELSRIGQPGERPAMVDPRAVLLQLHAEVKPRLEASGIELALPSDPPLVYCDRTRLYQVLSNLIGNAIHHMGSGSRPRVDVDVLGARREHLHPPEVGRPVEQRVGHVEGDDDRRALEHLPLVVGVALGRHFLQGDQRLPKPRDGDELGRRWRSLRPCASRSASSGSRTPGPRGRRAFG